MKKLITWPISTVHASSHVDKSSPKQNVKEFIIMLTKFLV